LDLDRLILPGNGALAADQPFEARATLRVPSVLWQPRQPFFAARVSQADAGSGCFSCESPVSKLLILNQKLGFIPRSLLRFKIKH